MKLANFKVIAPPIEENLKVSHEPVVLNLEVLRAQGDEIATIRQFIHDLEEAQNYYYTTT